MPAILKRVALLMALFGWFVSMTTQLFAYNHYYGEWPSQNTSSWSVMFGLWSTDIELMYIVIGLVGLLTIVSAVELYLYLREQMRGRCGRIQVMELLFVQGLLPVKAAAPDERDSTETVQ